MGMSAHEILPGRLWQRGRTDRLPCATKAEWAARNGIRWVVALCRTPDYDWETIDGVRYGHWEIPDGKEPPPGWLSARARAVADDLQAGGGALIYCNAGRNRSAFFAALVASHLTGCDGAGAARLIRGANPGALANPTFAAILDRLPCPA